MTACIARRALLGLAFGVALFGPTATPAAGSLAAHPRPRANHTAKHHKAKKRKSKRPGTTVTVKCAAVVVCVGRPGVTGPPGQNGANGTAGQSGSGAPVVGHIRSTGPNTTTFCDDTTHPSTETCDNAAGSGTSPAIVLTGASWSQGASEDQQFVGSASVTVPSSPSCHGGSDQAVGDAFVDGAPTGFFTVDATTPGTFTVPISFVPAGAFGVNSTLFETGAVQSHSMVVRVFDDCNAPSGSGATHPTISSVAIDVVAYR